MAPKPNLDCFDEFTARFIRSKVRKLIGRAGLTESDRQDLVQEFAEDVLRRRQKFDADTGTWEGFVVVVCQNRYATILERCRAKKRSHECEDGSLNRSIWDADGNRTDLGDTLPDTQQELRTGQRRRALHEAWELSQDLTDLLRSLPPLAREVCKLLIRGRSKAAVARELGISKGTMRQIVSHVLKRFENTDLRDYVK